MFYVMSLCVCVHDTEKWKWKNIFDDQKHDKG